MMLVATRVQFVSDPLAQPYKDQTNSHPETIGINQERKVISRAFEVIHSDHDLDLLNRVRPGDLTGGVQAKLFQIFDGILDHAGNLAIGPAHVNQKRRTGTRFVRGVRIIQRCLRRVTLFLVVVFVPAHAL
jgi:hypothetical protein